MTRIPRNAKLCGEFLYGGTLHQSLYRLEDGAFVVVKFQPFSGKVLWMSREYAGSLIERFHSYFLSAQRTVHQYRFKVSGEVEAGYPYSPGFEPEAAGV